MQACNISLYLFFHACSYIVSPAHAHSVYTQTVIPAHVHTHVIYF